MHTTTAANSENQPETPEEVKSEFTASGQCAATTQGSRPRVCLRIIPVKVSGADGGREIETYAFLDDGSDTTLCTKGLTDELGLSGKSASFTLTTVNAQADKKSGIEVQLNVKSFDNKETICLDRVLTVDHLPITDRSIANSEDALQWSHLQDIEFPRLINKKVTILIGSDVPEAHWVIEQRLGRRKQPYAVRTLLGWTLVGPTGTARDNKVHVNLVNSDQEVLSEQLHRMYNAEFNESPYSVSETMSIEDRRALSMMEHSTRKVDGHYQLGLPWRYSPPCLSNNRSMAEKRLHLLKRRLEKDPALHEKYKSAISVQLKTT